MKQGGWKVWRGFLDCSLWGSFISASVYFYLFIYLNFITFKFKNIIVDNICFINLITIAFDFLKVHYPLDT